MSTADDLEAALRAHAIATDCAPEGWVVTDWVIVGAAVGPKPDRTCYFRMYSGGTQARHITLGLLATATGAEQEEPFDDGEDDEL